VSSPLQKTRNAGKFNGGCRALAELERPRTSRSGGPRTDCSAPAAGRSASAAPSRSTSRRWPSARSRPFWASPPAWLPPGPPTRPWSPDVVTALQGTAESGPAGLDPGKPRRRAVTTVALLYQLLVLVPGSNICPGQRRSRVSQPSSSRSSFSFRARPLCRPLRRPLRRPHRRPLRCRRPRRCRRPPLCPLKSQRRPRSTLPAVLLDAVALSLRRRCGRTPALV